MPISTICHDKANDTFMIIYHHLPWGKQEEDYQNVHSLRIPKLENNAKYVNCFISNFQYLTVVFILLEFLEWLIITEGLGGNMYNRPDKGFRYPYYIIYGIATLLLCVIILILLCFHWWLVALTIKSVTCWNIAYYLI